METYAGHTIPVFRYMKDYPVNKGFDVFVLQVQLKCTLTGKPLIPSFLLWTELITLFCASKILCTEYYYDIDHPELQVVVCPFVSPVDSDILESEDNTLLILASPSWGSVSGSQSI